MTWFGHRRIIKALACVAVAFIACTSYQLACAASEDESTLSVAIRDASTGMGARGIVKVIGPLSMTRSTAPNGTLVLPGLPPGTYSVQVGAFGYKSSGIINVELRGGETSALSFDLAARQSSLRTIGRISSIARRSTSFTEIGENSALRHLAENLDHAIGNLPGVDFNGYGNDGLPQALYGLEGHDPTQTGISLDGVPMNAPGTSFDGTLLATDLLASAAVAFGPASGFTGGTIDYRTAVPTRIPVADIVANAGPNGSSTTSAMVRGSAGSLGYVVGSVHTSSDSAIAGDFLDWTGTAGDHTGGYTQHGMLAKFQLLLGDSDLLAATMIRTTRTSEPICPIDTTLTPCGFGPASSNAQSSVATLRLLGTRERWSYLLSGFAVGRTTDADFASRTIAGFPFPSTTFDDTRFGGVSGHIEYRPGARDRFALTFLQTSNAETFRQSSSLDSPIALSGSDQNRALIAEATRSFSSATRVGVQFSERRDTAGSAFTAGTSIATSLAPRDSLAVRFDTGGGGGATSIAGLTTEPDFLNYVCRGQAAFGRAGTIVSQDGSTTSERIAYTHTIRDGSFSLVAFDQVAHNVPFNYPINGSSYDSSVFASYLSTANHLFALPTVCPGEHLPASGIYLLGKLNGIDTTYRGVRATASFPSGNFRIDPYVSVLRATLDSANPVVTNVNAFLRSGDQLLGVPYVQSGLVIDFKERSTELAANVRYYSNNNPLYRNAFATLDFGAVFSTIHGRVTLRVTNVFDANRSAYAAVGTLLPMTAAGVQVPIIGRPFDGRRISVDYALPLGPRRNLEPTERVLATNPTTQPQVLTGLPAEAVQEPFALRNTSPGCDFATARKAEQLIAPIRAYDEAYRRRGSSPESPPRIAGTTVAYHAIPAGYELEMSIQSISVFSTLFQCMSIRSVDENELHAAGLVGSALSYTGLPLLFSSRYGFLLPTTKQSHVGPAYYQIGKAVPLDLFALVTAPSCTETYQKRAAELLSQIRAEIQTHGRAASSSNGVFDMFVGTDADSDPWVYFSFKDRFDLAALLNCAHISRGTRSELMAVRLGGAALPYLGFSSTYGFYFYRI